MSKEKKKTDSDQVEPLKVKPIKEVEGSRTVKKAFMEKEEE